MTALPAASAAWHRRSTEEVVAAFDVPVGGLSGAEAARRLAEFGRNELADAGSISAWAIFIAQFKAGLLMLDEKQPHVIRYRSRGPVLTPELPKERAGTVPNVVFPIAIDRRDDLGLPGRFDVYYGMADSRIGVARLDWPADVPI